MVSKYIAPAVLEIINPDQYGAIPKSSTIHALISMIHQWAQATDGTGSAVRAILFDYKKAFDLIDHRILLGKVRELAIPREIFLWIADFLTDRFLRVKLSNHYCSEWARVSAGVPQGTKLGPWLFLLMINDLKVKDVPSWKFVDDTTISEDVSRNSISQVQTSVDTVVNWSHQNRLQLNGDKCKEQVIDFKNQKHQFDRVMIEGKSIEVVHHAKILGLTVFNNLSWKNHINNIINC